MKITLIPLAALFSGCAFLHGSGAKPLGKIGRLGALSCPVDNVIRILDVAPGSPADKAGVKPGDVVLAVNGTSLVKPESRKEFGFAIRSGNPVVLSAKRENETLEFDLQPKKMAQSEFDPIDSALFDAIMSGKPVVVATVVTDVKTTFSSTMPDAMIRWKEGLREGVESQIEGHLLSPSLVRCGNYKVIDRNATHDFLNAARFKMGAAVDTAVMKEAGRMTGATYLLLADISNRLAPTVDGSDETALRLVEIESGDVLATARLTQKVPKQY